ncbi:DNA-binding protein [Pseudomonas sp. 3A(2025)]
MAAAQKIEFHTHPGAWFRQELLIPIFGISPEAARKYRSSGIWLEGKHWRKDPANRMVYSRLAIEHWMEGRP